MDTEERKRIALFNAGQCRRLYSYLIFTCHENEAAILMETAEKVEKKYNKN